MEQKLLAVPGNGNMAVIFAGVLASYSDSIFWAPSPSPQNKWVNKSQELRVPGCLGVPVRQSLTLPFFCSADIIHGYTHHIYPQVYPAHFSRHPLPGLPPTFLSFLVFLTHWVHLAPVAILTTVGLILGGSCASDHSCSEFNAILQPLHSSCSFYQFPQAPPTMPSRAW